VLGAFEQCDDGGQIAADGCDGVCALEGLSVQPPGGALLDYLVTGAVPRQLVRLVGGDPSGSLPIPGCTERLPLTAPALLGESYADDAGRAWINVSASPSSVVAIQPARCRLSPPITMP